METATATATATKEKFEPLLLPELSIIRNDLALTGAGAGQPEVDPKRAAYAREVAERLFGLNPSDLASVHANQAAVEGIGVNEQREAALKSQMLKEPIRAIAGRAEDGGPVAKSLVDLKMQMEALDPARFDFTPGWFSRMLGYLPFVGTPIKRYFTMYESSQTVLAAIKNSLVEGQKQLERDNLFLADDQAALNSLTIRLQEATATGQLVDQYLNGMVEREGDAKRKSFLESEILFPLRQRIVDISQSVAVYQQGVLAMELLKRTNKELIRGVNRALNTSMSALHIGVTVATAAYHQRVTLDKINGLNETTNNIFTHTAKELRQNVAETNKLASSAMLSMDALRQAFQDTSAAIDDVLTFRQKALPQMAQTVIELNDLTARQGEVVKRLEEGARQAEGLAIQFPG